MTVLKMKIPPFSILNIAISIFNFIFYRYVIDMLYSFPILLYMLFFKLSPAYLYISTTNWKTLSWIAESIEWGGGGGDMSFPHEQIEFPVITKVSTRSKRAFAWYRWSRIVLATIVCVVTRATFVYLFGTKQTRTFIRNIGKQSIIHAHTCVY